MISHHMSERGGKRITNTNRTWYTFSFLYLMQNYQNKIPITKCIEEIWS
jgi:hypothetical protein